MDPIALVTLLVLIVAVIAAVILAKRKLLKNSHDEPNEFSGPDVAGQAKPSLEPVSSPSENLEAIAGIATREPEKRPSAEAPRLVETIAEPPLSSSENLHTVPPGLTGQREVPAPPGVFISYRREDTQGYARALYDALDQGLNTVPVFRDIDSVRPGEDFLDSIKEVLDSCAVVIVVIGSKWLNAVDSDGSRRLDNPDDYVRVEVASALQSNALVLPVLAQGASMPRAADLPDDLKRLARRNALELSDSRWRFDVERLVQSIKGRLGIDAT